MDFLTEFSIVPLATAHLTLNSVLIAVIGAVLSLLVGVALRKLDRIDRRTKEQQECIEERDMLLFEVDSATLDLAITTGVAVRDQKSNGNLITAISNAVEVREKRANFLNRMANKAMTRGGYSHGRG